MTRFFRGLLPAAAFLSVRRNQYILAGLLLLLPAYFVSTLWRDVSQKLNAGPFASTSNFYASPRLIVHGDQVTAEQIVQELAQSGYTESPQNGVGHFKRPDPSHLEIHPGPDSYFKAEAASVRFADGKIAGIQLIDTQEKIDEYLLEPRLIANVGSDAREKRRLVTYSRIPKVLVNALLSVEDKRFFSHWGFDPLRLAKALYVDLRSGKKEQGGSTITMQLARTLWLDQNKNWRRKATEFLITLILEVRLSKQEILEHYANEIYLGDHNTYAIHGFGEGARVYFNKDIEKLTLSEAALLAGLVQRPSYFHPFQHPDRATARRDVVLRLMQQNGFIDETEVKTAAAEPLRLNPVPTDYGDAPYFVALAVDEFRSRVRVGEDEPVVPYRIYTTLDYDLQNAAVAAVQKIMPDVDNALVAKFGKEAKTWGAPQVALVALDPRTGEVKAAVGGRNYVGSQLNHLISKRQPGSVFKPFVYAAALNTQAKDRSGPITPASLVLDAPRTFLYKDEEYEPGNYGGEYYGEVPLRLALAHSLNVATVTLAEEVGYRRVAELAWQAGLNQNIRPTPSMALGSYETTPVEIGGAYTVFANGGVYTKPRFISSVRQARGGRLVVKDEPEHRAVLDPRINFLMVDMLEEVMRSGTGAGVRGRGFWDPAAGKTGTSRDGWFAGFTSELLCVVWVGFDDNRELGLEGARSALPVWAEFMKKAGERSRYKPGPLAAPPQGMTQAAIDLETGLIAGPDCPRRMWSYFLIGQEPREMCTRDHTITPSGPVLEPREDVVQIAPGVLVKEPAVAVR